MIEFIQDTLLLLPFLFGTYLVLEALEAHAGDALEKSLERARSIGPLAGAFAGVIPQCGVSAAAASFYAGGVISVGTLLAVFISTSDELLPILFSHLFSQKATAVAIDGPLLARIVLIKIAAAIILGFCANALLMFFRHFRREVSVHELCEHSHCSCSEHKGIVVPALIHTAEIFAFIVAVSGAIEFVNHFYGESWLSALRLTEPFVGEFAAGAIGLIPNCAVSAAAAEFYAEGHMSAGALMASSFTGSGLGLIVLFRTNRNWKENLAILATVYFAGVFFGWLAGHCI